MKNDGVTSIDNGTQFRVHSINYTIIADRSIF
jgi:hypothetical protein